MEGSAWRLVVGSPVMEAAGEVAGQIPLGCGLESGFLYLSFQEAREIIRQEVRKERVGEGKRVHLL